MPLMRRKRTHSLLGSLLLGGALTAIGLFICGLGAADILLWSQPSISNTWMEMKGFDPQQLYFFLGVKVTAESVPREILGPALLRFAIGFFVLWLGWRYLTGQD